jgi:hypothetical protein
MVTSLNRCWKRAAAAITTIAALDCFEALFQALKDVRLHGGAELLQDVDQPAAHIRLGPPADLAIDRGHLAHHAAERAEMADARCLARGVIIPPMTSGFCLCGEYVSRSKRAAFRVR